MINERRISYTQVTDKNHNHEVHLMRDTLLRLSTLALLTMTLTIHAQTFWRCTAYTRHSTQSWSRTRLDRYTAIVDSRAACEHHARSPDQCIVPMSSCLRVRPPQPYYQRCIVTDNRDRQWRSNGNSACHRAMRHCRQWHNRRGLNPWQCQIEYTSN